MSLLTQEVRAKLPKLYEQKGREDPVVHVKFFTPWSFWTWFVTEGEPALDEDGREVDFTFFGHVKGFEDEWGRFSLKELEGIKGPAGLRIERDLYFSPKPFSQIVGHG